MLQCPDSSESREPAFAVRLEITEGWRTNIVELVLGKWLVQLFGVTTLGKDSEDSEDSVRAFLRVLR